MVPFSRFTKISPAECAKRLNPAPLARGTCEITPPLPVQLFFNSMKFKINQQKDHEIPKKSMNNQWNSKDINNKSMNFQRSQWKINEIQNRCMKNSEVPKGSNKKQWTSKESNELNEIPNKSMSNQCNCKGINKNSMRFQRSQ